MLCGKMSVDYCEKRMEDTNVFVGKVQKFYSEGDFACQLFLYLNITSKEELEPNPSQIISC